MGCGCGMHVTTGPRSQSPAAGPDFSADGSGTTIEHSQQPLRRPAPLLAAASGAMWPIWNASEPAVLTPGMMLADPSEVPNPDSVNLRVVLMPLAGARTRRLEVEKYQGSEAIGAAASRGVEAAKRANHEQHVRKVTLTQLERTRRAMCFACPAVSSDGMRCLLAPRHSVCLPPEGSWRDESVVPPGHEMTSGFEGDRVAWICKGNAGGGCPLGRHPVDGGTADEDMVTHWAPWWFPIILRWYGVPEPLRWWIAVRRWKNDTLPKCGCSVALKQACNRLGWLGRKIDAAMSSAPKVRSAISKGNVFKHGPDEFWPRAFRYSRRWLMRWVRRKIKGNHMKRVMSSSV